MGKNAFLFWMLASPAIAGALAWLVERILWYRRMNRRRFTIR